MSNIIEFIPKPRTEAKLNLAEFIRMCKEELTVFCEHDSDFHWDNYCWKRAANFTKVGILARGHTEADALDENFIDFAKAYFRYQQGINPTGTKNESKALRCIEKAFLDADQTPNITMLNEEVLDDAAVIAREQYAKGSAYQAGREIEKIGKFVSDKHVAASPIEWDTPIPRASDRNKTGEKAKEERKKKLPNKEAEFALAEIFCNNLKAHRDIFTTSAYCMLLCAPSRGSQIMYMPVSCEDIPEEFRQYKDSDGNKSTGYGWNFNASKGYDPEIKWLLPASEAMARNAIQRIREITQPSRDFAKALEVNPDKFPRHPSVPDVGDDELLTYEQAAYALGLSLDNYKGDNRADRLKLCNAFLKSRGLESKDGVHTLNKLLPVLISKLPKGFPFVLDMNQKKKHKYSESLFCMFTNQLNVQRSTITAQLWCPNVNTMNDDLKTANNKKSIFDRWGYNDAREIPLKIITHAPRHKLNTAAQRGGMRQEDIAKWSSRKDIGQNSVYNHMLPEEIYNKLIERDTEMVLFGGDCFEIEPPTSIAEFNTLERFPVHSTEFGYCELPLNGCEKFRDCINCEEETCVKGDTEKLERMKQHSIHLELVVVRDEIAIEQGKVGKEDQTYMHNKLTLLRLNEKIKLMESEDIADGSLIRLSNKLSITPYERAITSRKEKGLGVKTKPEKNALENQNDKVANIRNLLKGGGFG